MTSEEQVDREEQWLRRGLMVIGVLVAVLLVSTLYELTVTMANREENLARAEAQLEELRDIARHMNEQADHVEVLAGRLDGQAGDVASLAERLDRQASRLEEDAEETLESRARFEELGRLLLEALDVDASPFGAAPASSSSGTSSTSGTSGTSSGTSTVTEPEPEQPGRSGDKRQRPHSGQGNEQGGRG